MPSRPVTIVGIATWVDEPVKPPIDPGAHPEHPIYLPPIIVEPPTEGKPEHPIYIPITPEHPIVLPPDALPPGMDLEPSHPIFIPVYPSHPIAPGGEKPPHVPPKPGDPNYPGYNPPSGGNVPQPVKK
jgi:hypothetical protein